MPDRGLPTISRACIIYTSNAASQYPIYNKRGRERETPVFGSCLGRSCSPFLVHRKFCGGIFCLFPPSFAHFHVGRDSFVGLWDQADALATACRITTYCTPPIEAARTSIPSFHWLMCTRERHHTYYYSDDSSFPTMKTTTTMPLVSPNKAPSKPAADRDSSSSLLSSAWAGHRRTISTPPPPLEDSTMMMLLTPPPLHQKRYEHAVPPGQHACVESGMFDQVTTPASSVLIELNSGLSILNNPTSADALRLVAPSCPTQERQEQGSSSVDGTISGYNGPILSSFDTTNDDDDDDDAELLASYFPRIRLQMRPSREQGRFVPHAGFIPIQHDTCEDAPMEEDK